MVFIIGLIYYIIIIIYIGWWHDELFRNNKTYLKKFFDVVRQGSKRVIWKTTTAHCVGSVTDKSPDEGQLLLLFFY